MSDYRISRRDFLKKVGAGAAGIGISSGLHPAEAGKPQQKIKTRVLGRTGLRVGEISFGSYGFNNPGVLEKALDLGMNLIDTGFDYQRGRAERAIGRVMKHRRNDAVLLTKWSVRPGTPVKKYLRLLDESLERLQTDHVEFIQNYDLGSVAPVTDEAFFEAAEKAREAGKVRFISISCHGGPMIEVMNKALETGKYHMIMLKYNFMEFPAAEEIISRAAENGVGVVAIKSGGSDRDPTMRRFLQEGFNKRQATIRWVLTNKNVTAVCCDFASFEDVEVYRKAVAAVLTPREKLALERYREEFDQVTCRLCGTCRAACPYGVRVDDIMRFAMYFERYKRRSYARWRYATLPDSARPVHCKDCDAPCVSACPHGLAVQDNVLHAARLLA